MVVISPIYANAAGLVSSDAYLTLEQCDGEKPQCSRCELKSKVCNYRSREDRRRCVATSLRTLLFKISPCAHNESAGYHTKEQWTF